MEDNNQVYPEDNDQERVDQEIVSDLDEEKEDRMNGLVKVIEDISLEDYQKKAWNELKSMEYNINGGLLHILDDYNDTYRQQAKELLLDRLKNTTERKDRFFMDVAGGLQATAFWKAEKCFNKNDKVDLWNMLLESKSDETIIKLISLTDFKERISKHILKTPFSTVTPEMYVEVIKNNDEDRIKEVAFKKLLSVGGCGKRDLKRDVIKLNNYYKQDNLFEIFKRMICPRCYGRLKCVTNGWKTLDENCVYRKGMKLISPKETEKKKNDTSKILPECE